MATTPKVVNIDATDIISISGINDMRAALLVAFDAAVEKYGNVPFELHAYTWDRHYGDTLPDGFIIAEPKARAFKLQERLAKHKLKKETEGA